MTIDPLTALLLALMILCAWAWFGLEVWGLRRRHDQLRRHVHGIDRQLTRLRWEDSAPPLSAVAEMARVTGTILRPAPTPAPELMTLELAGLRPPTWLDAEPDVVTVLRARGRATVQQLAIALCRPTWDVQTELEALEADGRLVRARTHGLEAEWSLAPVVAGRG